MAIFMTVGSHVFKPLPRKTMLSTICVLGCLKMTLFLVRLAGVMRQMAAGKLLFVYLPNFCKVTDFMLFMQVEKQKVCRL